MAPRVGEGLQVTNFYTQELQKTPANQQQKCDWLHVVSLELTVLIDLPHYASTMLIHKSLFGKYGASDH